MDVELPEGIAVGHWTDREGWTGCTAILGPPDAVSAGEVRGGGPGTREFDLLSPAAAAPGAQAILFTGGSAFGLGAAEGVVRWLEERGHGFATPAAAVPLVSAAVVYDLMLGSAGARPGADAAYAACETAGPVVERGSVGAGTGCTAGKLRGPAGWTKTGFGAASLMAGDARLVAVAAANPFGDIRGADGSVLAGVWEAGEGYRRTVELMREGIGWPPPGPAPVRQATTLVCLLTDARLGKTDVWKLARAGSAGVARAVEPSATALDGDLVTCMTTDRVPADPLLLSVLAAEVVAEAVRDAALSATGAPGCPAAGERS